MFISKSKPKTKTSRDLYRAANPVTRRDPRAFFLQTELKAGLTFASIAGMSKGNVKRAAKVTRNTAHARLAYDTILRFRSRIVLTPLQSAEFETGFASLREKLQLLGQTV